MFCGVWFLTPRYESPSLPQLEGCGVGCSGTSSRKVGGGVGVDLWEGGDDAGGEVAAWDFRYFNQK